MPGPGLFQVENPIKAAMGGLQQASGTLAQMQRRGGGTSVSETKGPDPTVGGALGAGLGGAQAGATIGSIVPGVGTAVGAIGGAVIGIAGYLLG